MGLDFGFCPRVWLLGPLARLLGSSTCLEANTQPEYRPPAFGSGHPDSWPMVRLRAKSGFPARSGFCPKVWRLEPSPAWLSPAWLEPSSAWL